LNGLGTEKCPKPNIPLNEGMQKWQAVPTETRNRLINYTQNFHGKTYGKITYIYIPAIEAYSQEKIDEAVKKGREELNKANIKNSSGIIVDLRLNTGGDIKSMLLTLGGILPEGKVFGLNPKTFVVLSEKGNRLSIENETYGKYSGEKPTLARNKPVAILTNWITASSAEITALSLRTNIKQSKVFGSNTSGSLSTNQTFFLWGNNTLNLMFERIYDSHGNTATLSLPVDKKMPDLDHIFTDDDQTIKAATNWIQSSLGKK
jgi:C-terminal processing protease CtpA/Prc